MTHPEMTDDEIANHTKTVFRYSMANLTSSINTGFISDRRIKKILTLKGQEHLTALAPDKGAIFMLLHMGNWEILGRLAHLLNTDKPTACMYRPIPNALLDDHIQQKRELAGTKLFSRKRGLIQAHKFLQKGGILGILSDQHAGKAGIKLPLFGKETSITPLPAILAQKHDSPIIPIALYTTKPGHWVLECKEPVTLSKELSKEDATHVVATELEDIMREHSKDIFWIHDRWKVKNDL